MAQRRNLFSRLTSLFRSGPIVKRKVRGFDSASVRSSALDIFRKSASSVYGNALNTYGQYDRLSRYADFSEMEYCLHGDTKIAVPGGYKTIKELADEYGLDQEFVVYSYDHNKRKVVPALGKQARKTRTDHAWKVVFENGQEIVGTANHRLMKRDGTFCKIEDLLAGDSLMPFVRKDFYANDESSDGYRWIYQVTDGYITEHKLIAEWAAGRELEENECVHHVNYKKWDNRPENLRIMTSADHTALHNNQDKWSESNSKWIENFKKQHSAWMRENNPAERVDITFGRILETCERVGFNLYRVCEAFDTDPNAIKRRLRDNGYEDFTTFARAYNPGWKSDSHDNRGDKNPRFKMDVTYQKICDRYAPGKTLKSIANDLDVSPTPILNRLRTEGFNTYTEFTSNYNNHKIQSIEYYGVIDLYDLTVDGYKNFATDSVISHNTPEIASALDIYADESVAKDDKGYSLHIYSENNKIQKILEELFYDTLNIEFVLRAWVRNLCKYGDFFLLNDVSDKYGIINAHPIPVNEITREEGYDPNNPFAVRFRWETEGNQELENWQVTHFRLLGNDAFLPYGQSVIEPARRIWRQLILAEDAMLVYRVIRSPERRVFYIDVGAASNDDIPNIMEQARTTLKAQEVLDKNTGRVDLRYNPWSVDIDYFLAVRGTETGTKIDTLPGGQNTTAIDDVEYIQRKLFAALKVPKAYLGFEEALSSKANLASEDVRFARSINQIQQVVVSELNKMAAIHLAAHGYDGEDLIDFSLQLSNPSTMAVQQKLELWRTKFEIAGTKPEGMFSKRFIYKHILNLTDEQIDEIEDDEISEIQRMVKLEQMGAPGEEGGGGGFGGGGGGGDFGGGGEDFGGDDLGGEDLGGGDDLGGDEGGDDEGGGDEEEDLFAADEEEDRPLLQDTEDTITLTLDEDEGLPVRQRSQASRVKHNRQRRRHGSGASQNNMPDIAKMLHHDNESYTDLYDKRFQRHPLEGGQPLKNPFKLEVDMAPGMRKQMLELDRMEKRRRRLDRETQSSVSSFSRYISNSKASSIIAEAEGILAEADKEKPFTLEEEDDE